LPFEFALIVTLGSNPSPVLRRLMKTPPLDTLSPRERAVALIFPPRERALFLDFPRSGCISGLHERGFI